MMIRNWLPAVVAVSALGLAACKHDGNKASDQPAEKPAVATVNGKPISAAAFEVWVQAQTNKKPEELPPEQRKQLLEALEGLYVSGLEAEKQNVAATPEVAARLELDRLNLLASTLFQNYAKSKTPSEADLKAEYDRQISAMPKDEYHARHILVKDEATAKDVIAKLQKGAKFEELAKQLSIDPGSKAQGGDLNWFTSDKMVKPFSDAVAALDKGAYTKTPVATQFGFHVIRLDDKRPIAVPPYEAVKDRIGSIVQQKMVHDYIDSLRKAAKIEETKVEAPATPAAQAAPTAPAAPAADAKK
jgi:peptidyl-prolyl cis-trans isomerase C